MNNAVTEVLGMIVETQKQIEAHRRDLLQVSFEQRPQKQIEAHRRDWRQTINKGRELAAELQRLTERNGPWIYVKGNTSYVVELDPEESQATVTEALDHVDVHTNQEETTQ